MAADNKSSLVQIAQEVLDVPSQAIKVKLESQSIQVNVNLDKTEDSVTAWQGGTWNITNITGTVSLPTGAATSAKQDLEIAELQAIKGYVDEVETTLTTISSNLSTAANQTNGTQRTKITDGTNNAALSASAPVGTEQALIVRNIPSGTQNVSVTTALPAGTNNIGDVDVLSVPAPLNIVGSGVGTSALRVQLADESLSALENISVTVTNTALEITNDAGNPIPVSGTVTANAGTGSFTVAQATATNLKTQAEAYQGGAAVSTTNPLQVTLANTGVNTNAIKVDGSAVVQPVNGTVTVQQTTATNLKVQAENYQGGTMVSTVNPLQVTLANTGINSNALKVDGSAVTQPISVVSLPLPSGAATANNQTAVQGSSTGGTLAAFSQLAGGVYNLTAPTLTTGQQAGLQLNPSGSLKVDGSAVTQPVSGTVTANAGTGSFTVAQATAANLNATVTGTVAVSSITTSITPGTAAANLGKAVDSAAGATDTGVLALAVRDDALTTLTPIDNDYTQLRVTSVGRLWTSTVVDSALPAGTNTIGTVSIQNASNYLNRIRLVYSTTNVTTGAWVQLLASVGGTAIREIDIFDSSGETLELGIGAAGSEVVNSYIFPGGNGRIPMQIAASARLSVRAVSATANSGELIINLYG